MDSHPLLQASSQDTCAYFQRTSESASAPSSKCPTFPSKRAAHYSRLFRLVNTSFRGMTPLLQTLTRRPLPKRAAYFSRLFVSVNNLFDELEVLFEVVAATGVENQVLTQKANPRSVCCGDLG